MNNERAITLPELLESRDLRVEHQKKLAGLFPGASLICFTVILPGAVKRDGRSLAVARAGVDAIKDAFNTGGHRLEPGVSGPDLRFAHPSHPDGWAPPVHAATGGHRSGSDTPGQDAGSVRYEEERDLVTGFEGYFVVDMEVVEAKRICCEIEDGHPLGRLMDIDVIERVGEGEEVRPIGRAEIGLPERRCLLCGRPARECMRAHRHSQKELHQAIDRMVADFGRDL